MPQRAVRSCTLNWPNMLSSGYSSTWVDSAKMSTYVDDMAEKTALADRAASPDPHIGLRSVRALRDLADRLEALQVANARRAGWSWQEVAEALGVSRQAVHKKHRKGEWGF
jgi:transcriptional regulator of acetoin/glycerol metabolism